MREPTLVKQKRSVLAANLRLRVWTRLLGNGFPGSCDSRFCFFFPRNEPLKVALDGFLGAGQRFLPNHLRVLNNFLPEVALLLPLYLRDINRALGPTCLQKACQRRKYYQFGQRVCQPDIRNKRLERRVTFGLKPHFCGLKRQRLSGFEVGRLLYHPCDVLHFVLTPTK